MRKQLHQSGLELLSKCGQAFYYRYILGIKRKPNAFLICGTATDRAVNSDLDHKIATGELEREDVLLDVARDAVETYPGKEEIELDDDDKGKPISEVLGATKDKAVRLVTAHHGRIAPEIRPFQTARQFSIDLDAFLRTEATKLHAREEETQQPFARAALNHQARALNVAARDGMDFVGEMDIVERYDEKQVIRDTKTSGKTPNESVAHDSHQLTAYSLAAFVVDGKLPNALKLDYLVDLKRETKTLTLETARDNRDVVNYLQRISNAVATIQSGIFVPAPNTAWWCAPKWCAYHSQCPYVRNQVQILPPAELHGKAGKNAGLVTIDVENENG